jgi:hypothetical protein
MTTDCGKPPTQLPLKESTVHLIVVCPTAPLTVPTPTHLAPSSPVRSREICPENDCTPAKPLIAPTHSLGVDFHIPSTQAPVCTISIVIVRVATFDEASVPIQFPAIFTGPGSGAGDGAGAGMVGDGAGGTSALLPQPTPSTTHVIAVATVSRRIMMDRHGHDHICGCRFAS